MQLTVKRLQGDGQKSYGLPSRWLNRWSIPSRSRCHSPRQRWEPTRPHARLDPLISWKAGETIPLTRRPMFSLGIEKSGASSRGPGSGGGPTASRIEARDQAVGGRGHQGQDCPRTPKPPAAASASRLPPLNLHSSHASRAPELRFSTPRLSGVFGDGERQGTVATVSTRCPKPLQRLTLLAARRTPR